MAERTGFQGVASDELAWCVVTGLHQTPSTFFFPVGRSDLRLQYNSFQTESGAKSHFVSAARRSPSGKYIKIFSAELAPLNKTTPRGTMGTLGAYFAARHLGLPKKTNPAGKRLFDIRVPFASYALGNPVNPLRYGFVQTDGRILNVHEQDSNWPFPLTEAERQHLKFGKATKRGANNWESVQIPETPTVGERRFNALRAC